jgi:tetratricopeptide (TPR) repeat protein
MLKKPTLILAFAFLNLLTHSQSADELNKLVDESFNKGDYASAEAGLKRLIKKEKDEKTLARYYCDLGTTQRRMDKNEEALKSYSRSIEYNIGLIDAYTNRATLHQNMGMKAEALKDYESALLINPLSRTALQNRAVLYGRENQLDLAKKDLQLLIDNEPKN